VASSEVIRMRITTINKEGVRKRRTVKVGAPFSESIHQRASFDGIYWFNVYVNGRNIPDEKEAPATIEKGMVILIIHEDADGAPKKVSVQEQQTV